MAHPKRRSSKTRARKRRTHLKITPVTYYIDNVSGEATRYHRVNLTSGYYRGRQVLPGVDDVVYDVEE